MNRLSSSGQILNQCSLKPDMPSQSLPSYMQQMGAVGTAIAAAAQAANTHFIITSTGGGIDASSLQSVSLTLNLCLSLIVVDHRKHLNIYSSTHLYLQNTCLIVFSPLTSKHFSRVILRPIAPPPPFVELF